jgi:hypothetical protein
VAAAVVAAFSVQAPASADSPVALTLSGSNGVGAIDTPGLECAAGGTGEQRTSLLETTIAPNVLGSLPAAVRSSIEVHTDPELAAVSGGDDSFLLSATSRTAVANDRGVIQATLTSAGAAGALGDCPVATLDYDPTSMIVTGSGTWSVNGGPGTSSGSYAGATGGGTFTLSARVGPGADNPWSLDLDGSVAVRQPALTVSVERAYWANLGIDYLTRVVTVAVRVTNSGSGDAYGARLVTAGSPTAGVTSLGPVPQALGDIAAGESTVVIVRYKLGLLGPCALLILGCNFVASIGAQLPDALDVPVNAAQNVAVHAPDLPPPL